MRQSHRNTWFAAGAAALAVAALVYALRPKPVGVDLAVVARGPLTVLVEEEGRTRVRQVYTVSAPVAGRVLRTALEAGDAVIKDQTVVAVIQPTDPPFLDARTRLEVEAQIAASTAAAELAKAELRQAEAELAFAETDLNRNERLARSGTVADRVLQKAKLETDTRRAVVTRAKAQVELRLREREGAVARRTGPEVPHDQLESGEACCVSVRAPMSGRILKRIHESEKVVPAGTPLVDIGDVGDIEIVVDLLSTDTVKIAPGASANVTGWGGGQALPAVVRRIEPSGFTKVSALGIEEQRVRVILDFSAPSHVVPSQAEGLGHDYRVLVGITTWHADNVLRVPLSALFRRGKEWTVFVAREGRARAVPIGVGQRNAELAVVTAGLAEGEAIILYPSDRVVEGVRVAAR
jgi:HlyD family secretion protein